MKQIRQRILEKRGADYTEEEIRELASVRLEKFLDPNNLRSDLLEQFRNSRPAAASEPPVITPPYTAEQTDIFATHRGIVRLMRKLFAPLLKLMFNANTLHQVLHTQSSSTSTCSSVKHGARSNSTARAPSGTRSTTRCCTTWCSKPPAWASRSRTCA